MFEREAHIDNASDYSLSDSELARFYELHQTIASRSLLNWAEHCTECTMPSCFTSCSFYSPREDLKCRRFLGGIKPVVDRGRLSILDITFNKWGKLEATGTQYTVSNTRTALFETLDRTFSKVLNSRLISKGKKVSLNRKYYGFKNRLLRSDLGKKSIEDTDAFVIEIYNPTETPVDVRFTLRNVDDARAVFQEKMTAASKFNRFQFDAEKYGDALDLSKPYLCQIEPLLTDDSCRLIFGMMDFISLKKPPLKPAAGIGNTANGDKDKAQKVKCIVWDLDNTLWKGTLIEDGADQVIPDERMISFIKSLDKKGILHAVASKNYEEDALNKLKALGIDHLFLYLQVNWGPKSISIGKIQQKLNIGIDSIVFVDDQVFEREEVNTAHPEVRVFDPLNIDFLEAYEAFNVPETAESRRRREMYVEEIARKTLIETEYTDNYESFLTDCDIRITMENLSDDTMARAHELAQRTNQMNFSGNRYTVKQLREITADNAREAHIIRCSDRFGDYGIIGLVIVNISKKCIDDMMFSCRIQSKMVDHGILAYFSNTMGNDLKISYRETDRNKKAADIFSELGFVEIEKTGDIATLKRPSDSNKIENNIVTIERENVDA